MSDTHEEIRHMNTHKTVNVRVKFTVDAVIPVDIPAGLTDNDEIWEAIDEEISYLSDEDFLADAESPDIDDYDAYEYYEG